MRAAASRDGAVYAIVDGALTAYVWSGETETIADAPPDCRGVAVWHDRIILFQDNLVFLSAMGDPANWDFGAAMEDVSAATVLTVGATMASPPVITAVVPFSNDLLGIASADGLWLQQGDPMDGGALRTVSRVVGIIGPTAYCLIDGGAILLSRHGLYLWTPGEGVQRFAEFRWIGDLLDVDAASHTIAMAYDPRHHGAWVFCTPTEGDGVHFWLDLGTRAVWPIAFAEAGHEPIAACTFEESVYVIGRDGEARRFSAEATDDDGTEIASRILLGPFCLGEHPDVAGSLEELHARLGAESTPVQWQITTADTAEAALDAAKSKIRAVSPSGATGTWSLAGTNRVERPRRGGVWCVVGLRADDAWSIESASAVLKAVGRAR